MDANAPGLRWTFVCNTKEMEIFSNWVYLQVQHMRNLVLRLCISILSTNICLQFWYCYIWSFRKINYSLILHGKLKIMKSITKAMLQAGRLRLLLVCWLTYSDTVSLSFCFLIRFYHVVWHLHDIHICRNTLSFSPLLGFLRVNIVLKAVDCEVREVVEGSWRAVVTVTYWWGCQSWYNCFRL